MNPLLGQSLNSWTLMGYGSVLSYVSHLPVVARSLCRQTITRRILCEEDLDRHALVSRGSNAIDAGWNGEGTTPEGNGSSEAWAR